MADRIIQMSMITVKTLKRKYLEQMRVMLCGIKGWGDVVADLGCDKPSRVVRGWITGKTVGIQDSQRLWVVHGPGPDEWTLIEPPSEGLYSAQSIAGLAKAKNQNVPQLFAD